MAGDDNDDFNRLYERLVVRRTRKKKRVAAATQPAEDKTHLEEDAAVLAQLSEAARLEEIRRKEQQEHDAKVSGTVKRLHLARNLRGFARLNGCSPHRFAFQLVDATDQDELRFLRQYQRVKRRRSGRKAGRAYEVEQATRLEGIAARLYLRRAADFRPEAATTLEGRRRVMDELLLFSPPNSGFLSQIGYAERDNVVPAPPLRLAPK
ncbi:hypothetical protein PHYPSEUDO_006337 [Phytophthora pseudosyringae]|uniref:Uncharacterized protein n=1 Tax=Phytophthora pseudosyringae TaxID=221518 RepID=A0A8T1VJ99_9STRA|nr:hypothetical protein PHYPSEUDO_006337 [Phytophthora pseudosyringae]